MSKRIVGWLAAVGAVIAAPSVWAQGAPQLLWEASQSTSPFVFGATAVAWSPDGKSVAFGSADRWVRLRAAADGSLVRSFLARKGAVQRVAFSPDGARLGAIAERSVGAWRVSDGAELGGIETFAGIPDPALSPDGKLYGTAVSGTITLASLPSLAPVRTIAFGSRGYASRVGTVTFSPDSCTVLATDSQVVKLWRVSDGALLATLTGSAPILFAPDGLSFVTGSATGLSRWRAGDGAALGAIDTHGVSVSALAFARNGRSLAAGGYRAFVTADGLWDQVGVVSFIRLADGAILHSYDQETGIAVLSLAFSPDQTELAFGRYDGTAVLALTPALP